MTVAELGAAKILKGSALDSPIKFRILVPDEFLAYGVVGRGQFAIFFLKRINEGYQVLDPVYPSVIAIPGAPGATGSAVDRVTAELAYVLVCPQASSLERKQSVYALRTLRTQAARSALAIGARDHDDSVRVGAMAALLAQNDISFLAPAADLMLQPSQSRSVDQNLVDNLAYAIRFGLKDPKAIPTLGALLHAENVLVRRGAASALRNTKDPAAIKPLIKGLEDSDREVRYCAVVGLGDLTGQDEWTPAIDYFYKNEQMFLNHWREWAKTNQ